MTSRLASLLVQDGHVTAQRMAEAFQRQVIYGGSLDTIFLEMGLCDEEVLVDYLALAAELPLAEPTYDEDPGNSPASLLLPSSLAQRFRVAPVAFDGKTLKILVTDPPERGKLEELARMLQQDLDPRVGFEYQVYLALERVYQLPVPARYAALAVRMRQRAEVAGREPLSPRTPTRRPPIEVRFLDAEAGADGEPDGFAPVDPLPTPIPMAVPREATFLSPMRADAPRYHHGASSPLAQEEGLRVLQEATDRDTIFETLCRMARARFSFAALYTVQGDSANARAALGDEWIERDRLEAASVSLDQPSSFRTAIESRAPYLGLTDDSAPVAQAMAMLGRRERLWAALLPVAMRERTVALFHIDDQGRMVDAAEVADLVLAVAEAARAFQRIILRTKASRFAKTPTSVPTLTVIAPAASRREPPQSEPAPAPADAKCAAPPPSALISPARAALVESFRKDSAAPPPRANGSAAGAGDGAPSKPVARFGERPRPITNPKLSRNLAPSLANRIGKLLEAVEEGGGDLGDAAAEELLKLGEDAAWSLARRLPGPLRLVRNPTGGSLSSGTPPAQVQHGPLLALAPLFGQVIVPHLLSRLDSPSLDVRFCVSLVLGEMRHPEVVAPLGGRLFDHDAAVRRAAVGSLARFEPSREIRDLVELLRGELLGPDTARQRHAAEALSELRDVASVLRLIELLKHKEVDVVDAAHRALVQITKQDFGGSRWRWRSWWDKHHKASRIDWMLAGLNHRAAEVRLSASDELQSVTNDCFVYHADLPKRDREEARLKWAAWYKQHPGLVDHAKEP
ncbi:MAG: hypothetical protein EXR72_25430 [Myxococcales bacterium]|nr:hypothetical protein [Myxococcales bacterium]